MDVGKESSEGSADEAPDMQLSTAAVSTAAGDGWLAVGSSGPSQST